MLRTLKPLTSCISLMAMFEISFACWKIIFQVPLAQMYSIPRSRVHLNQEIRNNSLTFLAEFGLAFC